jgi:hypothetical protein
VRDTHLLSFRRDAQKSARKDSTLPVRKILGMTAQGVTCDLSRGRSSVASACQAVIFSFRFAFAPQTSTNSSPSLHPVDCALAARRHRFRLLVQHRSPNRRRRRKSHVRAADLIASGVDVDFWRCMGVGTRRTQGVSRGKTIGTWYLQTRR